MIPEGPSNPSHSLCFYDLRAQMWIHKRCHRIMGKFSFEGSVGGPYSNILLKIGSTWGKISLLWALLSAVLKRKNQRMWMHLFAQAVLLSWLSSWRGSFSLHPHFLFQSCLNLSLGMIERRIRLIAIHSFLWMCCLKMWHHLFNFSLYFT